MTPSPSIACSNYMMDTKSQDISPGSPASSALEIMPEGYYTVSPSDGSWGQQQQQQQQQQQAYNMNIHDQRQQQQLTTPSPFYGQGNIYPNNQVVHHHHAYYPNTWHPTPPPPPAGPPVMPSIGLYYGHHQQQQQQSCPTHPPGPPPPSMTYQAIDSRGSLSSYDSSSDTLSASARRRHGGGRRQSRRGGGGGSRHHHHANHGSGGGSGGGGGGGPPNRAWYRYDDSTTLYQMRGRIIEIAKDRDGSKFIQRRLQVADYSEVQIAFEEVMPDMEALWNDVYGNYILQGLLELGTEDMRSGIGQKIIDGDVVSLSMKVYGCRLIQKALDTLAPEDVANIVASIKGKVWLLVHDHNGNHVIQKSVTKINEFFHQASVREDNAAHSLLLSSMDIIIDEVTSAMKDLAIHPYGCRVVQRLIENCIGSHKTKVLDSILLEGLFSTLINHEYGNYVVQRVLAYGRPSDRAAIFDAITSNILKLSKQKHSSNVVEMMLKYGDATQRHQIIEEILVGYCVDEHFASKSAAVSMAENAFANYVVKTSLDVLEEGPQKERMFNMLLSSVDDLEKSPFAKQILLRVKAYAQQSAYE